MGKNVGTTPLKEARTLQRLMFAEASKPDCKPSVLALLARSWCLVQESIRIMRGIPSPGQLRPDLDHTQLMRQIKRARSRQPIELLPQQSQAFYDSPDAIGAKNT